MKAASLAMAMMIVLATAAQAGTVVQRANTAHPATAATRGGPAVSGRAKPNGTITGQAKPAGSINGGKH